MLAFDYRGYGQSQFVRPSEAHWRQDAEWALKYLTGTRHIAARYDSARRRRLGANLALEVAAAPSGAGRRDRRFADVRSRWTRSSATHAPDGSRALADARPLRPRPAAERLHIPVLWFEWNATGWHRRPQRGTRCAYEGSPLTKSRVAQLAANANQDYSEAVGLMAR